MLKNLTEAIVVQDAQLIGTAHGYDLFDIRTYAAAQQFVVENTNRPAGEAYTHNQTTFDDNINENQKLYFFVENNTNKVFAGAVKSNTTNSTIRIAGERSNINIHVNFLFETNSDTAANKIFPLYLIPGVIVDNAAGNLIIENNVLKAILPQLTDTDTLDRDGFINLDLTTIGNINAIDVNAFYYGINIGTLTIGDNITTVPANAFDNVNHIKITWLEQPDGWAHDWDESYKHKIEYTRQEEIDAAIQQREQEAELQRQREAEEERQFIERKNREMIASIRYKKEGKSITILGVKPSFTGELIIPETIDNLPVTRIAPFAFYWNVKVEAITLPPTINFIGQGAFAYTNLKKKPQPSKNCYIGKNAFYHALEGRY
jgi:hypothetical protein